MSALPKTLKTQDVVLFCVMAIITLVFLSPIFWLFSASFQGPGEIYQTPFKWIPKHFRLENFSSAWTLGKLNYAFLSTTLASAIMLTFHLVLCTMTGYVFAKYTFRWKNIIFTLILITMMLPQEVTYFSVYDIVRKLGLINTSLGLAIPFFYSGFGIFFMRQFAFYVPNEMLESARIDGCSETRLFFQIAAPLMKPGIAALTILAFTFIWNEFAWARLACVSEKAQTLAVALATLAITSHGEIQTSEILAGGTIATMPVMILFLIFQRRFIESVTTSGMKG